MEPDTIRIVLDVRSVGDSITGRASAPGTETREFAGWLGLLAALEALARGTSSRPTPGPPLAVAPEAEGPETPRRRT